MALNSRYARNVRVRRAAEQGNRCCYCRRPFTETGPTRPTIEHCKAKMDGGRDNVANLKAACDHCNKHRGRQMNRDRQAKKAAAKLAPPAPPR
ncbi:HNH endonuclease [Sphingomonas sp. LB-2]|uniref:HNH endonuclease n=1 Tax=Sphingomonas caeni TaxID=2984949 RepID=UPI0022328BC9|nr:HNH endonuclease [Sphingomonas caeni]MCW3848461.1 HNH endonuclease [Sphingomonas caeni]